MFAWGELEDPEQTHTLSLTHWYLLKMTVKHAPETLLEAYTGVLRVG